MNRPINFAIVMLLAWGLGVVRADEPQPEPAATSSQPQEKAAVAGESASPAAPASEPPPRATAGTLTWTEGLADGRRRAQTEKKPMLVRAGAAWCTWCNRLHQEMEQPQLRMPLERWTLVDIDVDKSPDEARRLSIGPIPALRLFDLHGRQIATHDGYLDSDALTQWLRQNYDAATAVVDTLLTSEAAPGGDDIARLVKESRHADPLRREAAMRRMLAHPAESAAGVVTAFREGPLAARLAMLEMLTVWDAPVGELDPWRPETLAPERLKALEEWLRDHAPAGAPRHELTEDEIATAERDLARYIAASDADAIALRERLSRAGPALLPLVTSALDKSTTDRQRELLQILRYRALANESLVLNWPGGLERLGSLDANTRHAAVGELADRATGGDEALLFELFKDADPLVREVSLRGLQNAGNAQSGQGLAALLKDPEPNVRAAVLKQLAQQPSPALIPAVAEYVAKESDPDLVIHAVRMLKATKNAAAMECLLALLAHDSWQVRAEAAEAVGEIASRSYGNSDRQASAYVALIQLLEDEDPFVISRALGGLKHSDLAVAVEPLARIVDKHPDLAPLAVETLIGGETMRRKALPHLRKYATHANPGVRAAAVGGLVRADDDSDNQVVIAALADPESVVRQAAARVLNGMFRATRTDHAGPAADEPDARAAMRALFGEGETTETPAPDDWLARYRAGKGRPKWMSAAIEPLIAMLKSEDQPERLAAALALVPLGHDDLSMPVLKDLARQATELQGEVGGALAWLPPRERRELFTYLIGLKPTSEELNQICRELAAAHDPRDADLLWSIIASHDVETATAESIMEGLEAIYQPNSDRRGRRNRTVPPGEKTLADLERHATHGAGWERTAALAILLSLDPERAATAAQTACQDTNAKEEFRADAFQVLLLASKPAQAEQAAVKEIAGDSATLRRLAVLYLCRGSSEVRQLRGHGKYLDMSERMNFSMGQPEPLSAPGGLTVAMVRPLLDDADPTVAAAAGFLLASLGDKGGVDKLIEHWRTSGGTGWAVTVAQALAAIDDEQYVPTLTDIYTSLESHEVRTFYWAIRSMHGPEVLKLRKRIRDEVGMDSLR